MKTYIAAIALALTATPAMATPSYHSTCKSFGDLARQVMTLRQDGYPAPHTMDVALEAVSRADWWRVPNKYARELVAMAYTYPRYRAPANYQDAVALFGDNIYIGCMEGAHAG